MDSAVKYVPYSYVFSTTNMQPWNKVRFSLEDSMLPEGLSFNPATGELYGVPKKAGEYEINIRADYSEEEFSPSWGYFTLVVNDNTNENVYTASDEGYEVKHSSVLKLFLVLTIIL